MALKKTGEREKGRYIERKKGRNGEMPDWYSWYSQYSAERISSIVRDDFFWYQALGSVSLGHVFNNRLDIYRSICCGGSFS